MISLTIDIKILVVFLKFTTQIAPTIVMNAIRA